MREFTYDVVTMKPIPPGQPRARFDDGAESGPGHVFMDCFTASTQQAAHHQIPQVRFKIQKTCLPARGYLRQRCDHGLFHQVDRLATFVPMEEFVDADSLSVQSSDAVWASILAPALQAATAQRPGRDRRPLSRPLVVTSVDCDVLGTTFRQIQSQLTDASQTLLIDAAGRADSGDTFVSRGTASAISASSAAIRAALNAVLRGDRFTAAVLIRPPGHHCSHLMRINEAQMGFCVVNTAMQVSCPAGLSLARAFFYATPPPPLSRPCVMLKCNTLSFRRSCKGC